MVQLFLKKDAGSPFLGGQNWLFSVPGAQVNLRVVKHAEKPKCQIGPTSIFRVF